MTAGCAQADVQWHRLASPHADLGGKGPISFLLNLDLVETFRHMNDEAVRSIRSVPFLAVDQDGRATRLHSNCEGGRFTLTHIGPPVGWPIGRRRIAAALRRNRCAVPLFASFGLPRISRRCWTRRQRVAGSERLERPLDLVSSTRQEPHRLADRPMTLEEDFDDVLAGSNVQPLERTVERIDNACVVAVHIDLRVPWRDL